MRVEVLEWQSRSLSVWFTKLPKESSVAPFPWRSVFEVARPVFFEARGAGVGAQL